MNEPASVRAAHLYYRRALDEHFRGKVLPALRAAGLDVPSSTANAWKKPENAAHIPAWFLFAIRQATGLSLDEVADAPDAEYEEPAALRLLLDRLDELEAAQDWLLGQLSADPAFAASLREYRGRRQTQRPGA